MRTIVNLDPMDDVAGLVEKVLGWRTVETFELQGSGVTMYRKDDYQVTGPHVDVDEVIDSIQENDDLLFPDPKNIVVGIGACVALGQEEAPWVPIIKKIREGSIVVPNHFYDVVRHDATYKGDVRRNPHPGLTNTFVQIARANKLCPFKRPHGSVSSDSPNVADIEDWRADCFRGDGVKTADLLAYTLMDEVAASEAACAVLLSCVDGPWNDSSSPPFVRFRDEHAENREFLLNLAYEGLQQFGYRFSGWHGSRRNNPNPS